MNILKKRSAGSAKWIALCASAVIVAGLFFLIHLEFSKIQETMPAVPVHSKMQTGQDNKKKVSPVFDKNAISAPADEIDLQGEKEPTQEELIRQAILKYLRAMRGVEITDAEKAREYPRLRKELEELLRNLPDSAVPIIGDLLEKESDYVNRRILIYGLADIGTDSAASVLNDFFLRHIADKGRESELKHVIKALGMTDTDTSFNALVDFSKNNEKIYEFYRPSFVEAIGKQTQGYKALPMFQDFLFEDNDHSVRNKAAQAIKNVAKIDPERAKHALPDLMQKVRGGDPGKPGEPDNVVVNDSKYVKQTSLGAIGQIGDESSIPFLVEVGTMDKSFGVRLSAAAAVSRIGGDKAEPALEKILDSQGNDNKKIVVGALAELKIPTLLPFFEKVVTGELPEAVKSKAVYGIWKIGGQEAKDVLMSALKAEKNETIRKEINSKIKYLTKGGL